MGLDMYAYTTKAKPAKEVDFSTDENDEQIYSWRKHPNLHGWMQNLYDMKGGKSPDFNGDCVVLDSEDLDNLEQDIKDGNLPDTSGFFFGASSDEVDEADLEFVTEARRLIVEGYTIYYTSWW
jgi:hypothetical protein